MRFFIVTSVLMAACGGTASEPAAETPAAETPAATEGYVLTDAHEAVLAKADAHDGTEDHVVSECSVCGLGMQGDAAHAVTVGEYQVHMCSETCKGHFEENIAGTLDRVGEIVN